MNFERFIKADQRPITARRIAAAQRALDRKKEEVSLFPELQPKETPEERCARFDQESVATIRRWRSDEAARWKRARKAYYNLSSDDRAAVNARWRDNRFMPKTAVYLLETLRAVNPRSLPRLTPT